MAAPGTKVEHVVVLMLENRSFDHLLGLLPHPDPGFDGLRGDESNPLDPRRGAPELGLRRIDAAEAAVCDPAHTFSAAMRQMYGRRGGRRLAREEPNMRGFAWVHAGRVGRARAGEVMTTFAPGRLPVLTRLALEYAVCDRWFSSVPGPTWPNRLFCHAASSGGRVDNRVRLYDLPTVFHRLASAGRSFRIYHDGVPQVASLPALLRLGGVRRFFPFERFAADVAAGDVAHYTFIEPDHLPPGRNNQHPTQDVGRAEGLIAAVYRALRGAEAVWRRCVLVVLWDEHGGFFDHVPPPPAVPPEGGSRWWRCFDFDRLGPRVPCVVVSPWIERGTVDHTVRDHSSIAASLREAFDLAPLTARDAAAAGFLGLLTREQAREDLVELAPLPILGDADERLGDEIDDLQRGLISLRRRLAGTWPP